MLLNLILAKAYPNILLAINNYTIFKHAFYRISGVVTLCRKSAGNMSDKIKIIITLSFLENLTQR